MPDCCEDVPQVEMPNSEQLEQFHEVQISVKLPFLYSCYFPELAFLSELSNYGLINHPESPKINKQAIFIINQVFLI